MRETKLGRQPASEVLLAQGWTVASAARKIEVPYFHLFRCLSGDTHPSPGVRRGLPKLLGVPLKKLFTADSLARPYRHTGPNVVARDDAPWVR